jgi:hypothetical protein
MSIQKYKSIVAVLSISLILGNAAPQPAMADNLPADTAYSEGINQHYNLEFIPAQTKFNAIYTEPAGTSKRTSAKYKSWLKKVNASSNKIYKALFNLGNLPKGPSYSSSDLYLSMYSGQFQSYLLQLRKSLEKKKAVKTDELLLGELVAGVEAAGDKWIALYTEDFTASNLSAPKTNPNVTFSYADDPSGSKILYATLSDTATFSQQALRVTSYDFEWYEGATTATSIPGSADIEPIKTSDNVFSLNGAVAGGLYFFRIKAVNSVGAGPWSPFFQATIPG